MVMIRAALIQTGLEGSFHPKAQNLNAVLEKINAADAGLILLPEMWPTGYASFDRYADDAEPLDGPLVKAMCAAARAKGCWLMPGSFAESLDGRLYNTTMLIDPQGEIKGVYRKIHVFGYQSREKELISKGPAPTLITTPFGKVGLAVCYDLRFPELFRHYAKNGAQMFLVTASWPSARKHVWELFAKARAHENMCWMLACNSHADSLAIAPTGEVMVQGPNGVQTLYANVDMDLVKRTREDFPVLDDAHWVFP